MTEEFQITRCKWIWNTLQICLDDIVEIYPRGMKSMIAIQGKVVGLSDSALVISTDKNDMAIRYSEIRMIRKLKLPKQ